ncbi:tape measure protein [Gordonia sp. DT101]|uniref:tape measure protein n=1 Tax=Gordonia sp. DT101 TaxID=3416545 RepID=UPI003CF2C72E
MAESVNLATAYVEVVPSLNGFHGPIRRALGDMDRAFGGAGSSSGQTFSQRFTGVAGKALKGGAVALGGAVAGVLGTALTKGFARLNSLDQAKSKMAALKMSTQDVSSAMESANKAVKGTSFGLDEAAGAAATAAAAGVKLGVDMDRYLGLVADAAAVGGASLGEMGAIFGKVAGKGKLDGEVMAQLLDRQIGILPALAKHYNVTTEEAQKMVSEGKVSFADFQTVMEGMVGGGAEKMGKTFSGSLANMNAALGRFGAKLLEPVFSRAPAVFEFLTNGIDSVSKTVGPFISSVLARLKTAFAGLNFNIDLSSIGDTLAAARSRLQGPLTSLKNTLTEDVVPTFARVAEIAAHLGRLIAGAFSFAHPAISLLAGLLAGALATAFNIVAGVVGGVASAISTVVDWMARNKEIISVVAGIIVASFLPALISMGATMLANGATIVALNVAFRAYALGTKIAAVATKTFAVAQNLLKASLLTNPIFLVIAALVALGAGFVLAYKKSETFRNIVNGAWNGIKTAVSAVVGWFTGTAWPAIKSFFAKIGDAAGAVVGFIRNHWRLIISIIGGPLGVVVALVTKHWSSIQAAIGAVWGWISGTLWPGLQAVFRTIGSVVMWLWNSVFTPAFNGIKNVISLFWAGVQVYWGLLKAAFQGVATVAMWLWNNVVTPAFNGIQRVVSTVVSVVVGAFNRVVAGVQAISTWISNLVAQFVTGCASILATVSGWISSILGFFGGLISSATEAVTSLWSRVSEGFSSGVTKAVDFVKQIPGKIAEALQGAGTWLVDTGKSIIQGLINGIKSMAGAIVNALVNLLPGPLQGAARSALGLFTGGWLPAFAEGGYLGNADGQAEGTRSRTAIKPGGFIVNARQTRRNRALLEALVPGGRVLTGPGTGTSDSILGVDRGRAVAKVSAGEFYAPPEQASAVGGMLQAINAGQPIQGAGLPAFAEGGALPAWTGGGGEANLKAPAILARRLIKKFWNQIREIGGYRASDPYPDHPSGRALDIMIPEYGSKNGVALGTAIRDWLHANKNTLGLNYLIWRQNYEPGTAGGSGNKMEDRGSDTQNHYDHIHALFDDANPDVNTVPAGLKYPAGQEPQNEQAPDSAATLPTGDVTTPATAPTPSTVETTETEKPTSISETFGGIAKSATEEHVKDLLGFFSISDSPALLSAYNEYDAERKKAAEDAGHPGESESEGANKAQLLQMKQEYENLQLARRRKYEDELASAKRDYEQAGGAKNKAAKSNYEAKRAQLKRKYEDDKLAAKQEYEKRQLTAKNTATADSQRLTSQQDAPNTLRQTGSGGSPLVQWKAGDGAEPWRPLLEWAINRVGRGLTTANSQLNAGIAQIGTESGGDPNIEQQVQDVNSGVDPAVGLLQIIGRTFAANRDPNLPNDRKDPAANVVAALQYYIGRYGSDLTKVWGQGHGYKHGGLVRGPGTSTSDSIRARLSDREFVVNAAATRENLPLLEDINAGRPVLPELAVSPAAASSAGVYAPTTNATFRDEKSYYANERQRQLLIATRMKG